MIISTSGVTIQGKTNEFIPRKSGFHSFYLLLLIFELHSYYRYTISAIPMKILANWRINKIQFIVLISGTFLA
jgi:hypothetical protein